MLCTNLARSHGCHLTLQSPNEATQVKIEDRKSAAKCEILMSSHFHPLQKAALASQAVSLSPFTESCENKKSNFSSINRTELSRNLYSTKTLALEPQVMSLRKVGGVAIPSSGWAGRRRVG